MSALIGLAETTVLTWTSLYTWRLPDYLRDTRQAEIESDLWEHQQLANMCDEAAWQTSLAMMLRFLMGMLADFTWRLETGAMVRAKKRDMSTQAETGTIRWLVRSAYMIIFLVTLMSIQSIIMGATNSDLSYVLLGGTPLVASVPIIYGLRCSPKRQPMGILLVSGGCLLVTLTWYWVLYATIPVSVGLIALSYYRGRRTGWGTGTHSTPAT